MKTMMLFALMMSTIITLGQDSSALKTERKKLYYEKVFDMPGKNIPEILSSFIPTIKGVASFYKTETSITAHFEKLTIDYQKYGCKWANTTVAFNHPMNANISIVWKEGQYKVTITDMIFKLPSNIDLELNNMVKKDGTLPSGKGPVRSMACFEKFLTDLFTYKGTKADW